MCKSKMAAGNSSSNNTSRSSIPVSLLNPTLVVHLVKQTEGSRSGPTSVVQRTSGVSGVSVQVMSNSVPVTVINPAQSRSANVNYIYKVKIINQLKRMTLHILRFLHHFDSAFKSLTELRVHLMDEFKENIPTTADFNIGYFEHSQQSKVWLVTPEDLALIYIKFPSGGNITLWCDGIVNESQKKRKRDCTDKCVVGRRQDQEDDVQSYYQVLLAKHKQLYITQQYRLWARMISSGIHDNDEDPPDIPAFNSNPPKRPRRESLSDSLTGAAIAFANSLKSGVKATESESSASVESTHMSGVSPRRKVELRMQNFEQLRYLQNLYEDNIFSEPEFKEQKENILKSLRDL